jgi:aryl-alcohol dehydrogenase-like predicted oxidoreductase
VSEVRRRAVGDSDLDVSVVGLGTNNVGRRLGLDATRALIDAALDAGLTFIDTADIYGEAGGSETLLGQVLEGRRDRVEIATKFGMDMAGANGEGDEPRGSRRYIDRAIDASLRRLRTDHVDLYQYHEPDGVTPVDETLEALNDLVTAGKVRHIGSSNFDAAQVEEADEISRQRGLARFVSAQNRYSLLRREVEADLAPACERLGIGIIPYSPLASGLLSGKYRRDRARPTGTRLDGREEVFTDEAMDLVERLAAFAEARGLSMLDVAIGGLAAQPAVSSVIAGAMTPDQVRANARAGEWEPSKEDLAELDGIASSPRAP